MDTKIMEQGIASGAGIIGSRSGKASDEEDEASMPELSRQAPVQWIWRRPSV
jgi:hypothetical protein